MSEQRALGLRLDDRFAHDEVRSVAARVFGYLMYPATDLALSVGEMLLSFPVRTVRLDRGELDLHSAEDAADQLERGFAPSDSRGREWATRDSWLILDGHYRPVNGRDAEVHLAGRRQVLASNISPDTSGHVWLAGAMQLEDRLEGPPVYRLRSYSVVPYEPRLQPLYEDHSLGESFVITEAMRKLMDVLIWPSGISEDDKAFVATAVRKMHLPVTSEESDWARRDDVRQELSRIVRTYDQTDESIRNLQADASELLREFERDYLLDQGFEPDDVAEFQAERWSSSARNLPQLPERRMVKTARAAEEYAAEVMEALGFTGVVVTGPGADGGVDVVSEEAVAQVKMEGISTGRPIVQGLFGAASFSGKTGLLFSLAGYTAAAIDWAEAAALACFEFELDGEISPRTSAAADLLRHGYDRT